MLSTDVRPLLIVSDFYLTQERHDEALIQLDKALEIDSDNQPARRMRGYVLFRTSDYRRAVEDLRSYNINHGHSISTHCWLAESLFHCGDWAEAVAVAEHLIDIDPEHIHAHYVRGLALVELRRPKDAAEAFNKLVTTMNHELLLAAAARMREIGEYTTARSYLERVAELQPDSRELWVQNTRLYIDEGAFEAAADSAKGIEALPDSTLLGRLFRAQAAAATRPLDSTLELLDNLLEGGYSDADDNLHVEATAGILTVSVRHFGPKFLPAGLTKLRKQLADVPGDGVLGRILTDFLNKNVDDGFVGALPEWEEALERLSFSLANVPDCRIPLQMLQAAVKYTKTGNERHLLSLPLEQRQLLEDVLPRVAKQSREP